MQFLKIFRLGAYRHLRRYISVEIAQPFFHDFSTKKYLNTHLWATKRKTIEFLRLLGKKKYLSIKFWAKIHKNRSVRRKKCSDNWTVRMSHLVGDLPHPLCWCMYMQSKLFILKQNLTKLLKNIFRRTFGALFFTLSYKSTHSKQKKIDESIHAQPPSPQGVSTAKTFCVKNSIKGPP